MKTKTYRTYMGTKDGVVELVPHVPVKYGKWEWKDFNGDGSLTLCCSECLETEGVRMHHKYCHNCGARMDGE